MNQENEDAYVPQQPFADSSKSKEVAEETEEQREMEAKVEVETEMGAKKEESTGNSSTQAEKEEVDARSIYVGNIDYACTPEEVQQHFKSCGIVNRVTILIDNYGHSKGYAYVEFAETEAVQNALLLNGSELYGRQLKVSAKRTNVPGMSQVRGFRYPAYSPYGQISRARRFMRYRPY